MTVIPAAKGTNDSHHLLQTSHMNTQQIIEDFILVTAHNPFQEKSKGDKLKVKKLCFLDNDKCEHPVNDATIQTFLQLARWNHVSIYPDYPELGCYVSDNELIIEFGEAPVEEIYYKDKLIYPCR